MIYSKPRARARINLIMSERRDAEEEEQEKDEEKRAADDPVRFRPIRLTFRIASI